MDVREAIVDDDGIPIILDTFLWLLHVVIGVAEADESLQLFWVVFERMLVILDGCVRVIRLEQQVAHGEQCERELAVDLQGDLEVLR